MKVTSMLSATDARAQNRDIPQGYDKRELIDVISVVALRNGEMRDIITVKTYMGRSSAASTRYAVIWIHARGAEYYAQGHGTAGGGGYCKRSAAIAYAIADAGIALDEAIDGRGVSAVRAALEAIARKLGYRKFMIVEN